MYVQILKFVKIKRKILKLLTVQKRLRDGLQHDTWTLPASPDCFSAGGVYKMEFLKSIWELLKRQ